MYKITIFLCLIATQVSIAKEYTKKNSVDRAHLAFSRRILSFSNSIDTFFANDKHANLQNRSRLKISMDTFFREARGPYVLPDLNYQLVLPKTQKRLRLVFENENEDQNSETNRVRTSQNPAQQRQQNGTSAALRYMIDRSGIQFFTDTGVIVSIPPVAFARFTARKTVQFTEWILKIDEQFRWRSGTGLTSDLDLDFDKRISRKLLFRMVNNTFWNDQDYIVRFENGPSWFYQISDGKAMSFHAHIITVNKPEFVIDNYLLLATYRQKLYKNWLFSNLSPFVNFPRDRNFHRTPGFLVGIDAVFGKI